MMISPKSDHRINTFEELAASDHKFVMTKYFKQYLELTGDYPDILKKIGNSTVVWDLPCEEAASQKYVIINPCEDFDYKYFELVMRKEHVKYFYIMHERILPYYRGYMIGIPSPFLEKWQYYMDWSFAGGLQQHWETTFSLGISTKHQIKNIETEEIYLSFSDMHQTFYLLLIGLFVSLLVFIIEITSRFLTMSVFMRVFSAQRSVAQAWA